MKFRPNKELNFAWSMQFPNPVPIIRGRRQRPGVSNRPVVVVLNNVSPI